MKKFYTLMCMAALALTSVAAPRMAKVNEPMQMSEEGKAKLATYFETAYNRSDAEILSQADYTRGWVDEKTGKSYTLAMAYMPQNQWWEMWQREQFTDFPFYFVEIDLLGYDANGKRTDLLVYPAMWPCYGWWTDEATEDNMLDMVPLSVLANDDDLCHKFEIITYVKDEGYYIWPDVDEDTNEIYTYRFMNPEACYRDFNNMLDGKAVSFVDDGSNPSSVDFYMFDTKTFELGADFNNYFTNGTSAKVPYDGFTLPLGFEPYNLTFEASDIHLYSVGQLSSATYDKFTSGNEWGPVYTYLVLVPGKYMECVLNEGQPSLTFADPNNAYEQNVCYSQFYVFSDKALGADNAEGKWALQELEIIEDPKWGEMIDNTPKANTMLPYNGYDDGLAQFGMYLVYAENYLWADAPAAFYLGSKEGTFFHAKDQYSDTVGFKTTAENVVLHPDAKDLTKTINLPATGNLEVTAVKDVIAEGLNISVANGNIIAPAGSVVYDLNGRRVNANGLENGIYVVRCGNKAAKVVVK